MKLSLRLTSMAMLMSSLSGVTLAAAPQNYYQNIDNANATTLKQSLHIIIKGHTKIPYTSSNTDTWDVLEKADENPDNNSQVVDVYKNAVYTKVGGGNTNYNREHSWPKSYGFPKDGSQNLAYTDLHHLFISNSSYNSSRNNKPYANCTSASCSTKNTDVNNNRGGSSSEVNLTMGSGPLDGIWQTWPGRRGDVARALMYLAVRYEGGTNANGFVEPDLILTDDRSKIEASKTGGNEAVAYMGLKTVLVQWHKDDPVDDFERRRNDVIFQYQGNRNPFIDHPEFAACIFESDCSGVGAGTGTGGGDTGGGDTGSSDATPWINELHYDNNGSDVNEGVEIAGAAGVDLSGWQLVAYNGNGGAAYKTISLSGTLADQQSGFGTKFFAISGLQNGGPDGIALVDNTGKLVQFLSYEGTFTATDGAAQGQSSTAIPVSETSSTAVGHALQLTGSGSKYSDFTWQVTASTYNQVNSGQSFNGGTPVTEPVVEETFFEMNSVSSIPDNSAMTSTLDVDNSTTSGTATVKVNISHTYRGDISLVLTSPTGAQYQLKNYSGRDSADNVVESYTVNLSGSVKGTWQLRVQDHYNQDVGTLNAWSIKIN
ncbi:endonuclease I [Pseudoalteromonas phenolica]|uniref:Endonuclease I n=1 Tax=Pseudoalteromonas phenolica TaxID=161398 RepID=A0A5S3YR81_9GAMM|nr:endonuclease [Pseudoalteromonas phenolica]TMP79371.1 endonuclease I [Pseudoalteromonas phenolica]